jgi:LysM repeat protein
MRTTRAFSLDDIRQRTGLSADQLKRFNPALVRRVPKGATLYLPVQSGQFGSDVAFWRRPPPPEYSTVLSEFLNLKATSADWEDPTFDTVLKSFRRRFRDTNSEEGAVMATVLGYVLRGMPSTRRILSRYRRNPRVRALLEEGVGRLGLSTDTRLASSERPFTTSALGPGMVESQTQAPSPVTARAHTVRSGENLSVIARRYGITLGALMAVNPGLSPRRLMPGTELLMPTPALGYVQTHRVRAGDNFSVIARAYGVSLNGLITANPTLDPRRLQIGQRLRIPADTN